MRATARRLIRALYNIDEAYYLNEGQRKISNTELCLMHVLADETSHSQREISEEWLLPKTSVNTIIKRWEQEGFVTLTPIVGKRREMNVEFTKAGRVYAQQFLEPIYRAEEQALRDTLAEHSEQFIEAIECFGQNLKKAFKEKKSNQ